ncbi:hypothetical protein [Paenibacillus glycinis]|uniref:DUF4363 family protein n=1 Tax=Paenibacillus glycinis TaxID=2697035 RepID=A0ABW9XNR3_9BACL|nr:hypothetical protein [Paenibacillus glycinis]NBD24071.1 hypothetical protein [Paenibacillus glycinis]
MQKPKRIIVIFSVVIAVLAVILINRVIKQNRTAADLNVLQQSIDAAFRTQLSLATSSLGTDFDEDESNFNACVAAVSAAAALADQTTYESRNDLIDVALNRFSKILLNPENRQTVSQHSPELRSLFVKLTMNPADVETTRTLSAFIGNVK